MNFLRLTAIAPIASAALILGGMSPASAETSFEAEVLETPVSQISEYVIDSDDQISSISTFSDVYPTDWPYQALKGLVESYGCVAG